MTKKGHILEKNYYVQNFCFPFFNQSHSRRKIWLTFKMSLNFDIYYCFLFVDLSLKNKRNQKFLIKLECLNSNSNIEETLLRKYLEFVTECTLHKRTVLRYFKNQFNLLKVQKRMKNLGKKGIR